MVPCNADIRLAVQVLEHSDLTDNERLIDQGLQTSAPNYLQLVGLLRLHAVINVTRVFCVICIKLHIFPGFTICLKPVGLVFQQVC